VGGDSTTEGAAALLHIQQVADFISYVPVCKDIFFIIVL